MSIGSYPGPDRLVRSLSGGDARRAIGSGSTSLLSKVPEAGFCNFRRRRTVMQVQVDLGQLSEASLHALLDENMGTPLGTQVLEDLLRRDSTVVLKPGFDAVELRDSLLGQQQGM